MSKLEVGYKLFTQMSHCQNIKCSYFVLKRVLVVFLHNCVLFFHSFLQIRKKQLPIRIEYLK